MERKSYVWGAGESGCSWNVNTREESGSRYIQYLQTVYMTNWNLNKPKTLTIRQIKDSDVWMNGNHCGWPFVGNQIQFADLSNFPFIGQNKFALYALWAYVQHSSFTLCTLLNRTRSAIVRWICHIILNVHHFLRIKPFYCILHFIAFNSSTHFNLNRNGKFQSHAIEFYMNSSCKRRTADIHTHKTISNQCNNRQFKCKFQAIGYICKWDCRM